MAWIELHQTVWTHRKTLIMAAHLDIPEVYAAAHMAHLWCWALDNAPQGDLTGLPAKVIAKGAGWTGDPETFIEAAVAAGYIDRDGDTLRLHDWSDYAGRLIQRRQHDAERKRRARATDGPATSVGRPADVHGTSRVTVPNRTVPNHMNDEHHQYARDEADGGAAPAAETGEHGDADSPSWKPGSAVAAEVAAEVEDAAPDQLRIIHEAYFEATGRPLMPGRDLETLRELLEIATPEQIARAIREVGGRARESGTRPRSLRYFADAVRELVEEERRPKKRLDYDLPDPNSEMERRRRERAARFKARFAAARGSSA